MTTLLEVALRLVVKRNGDYDLHPSAEERLDVAFEALFADKSRDPRSEIEALLRMAWFFETKHFSFALSDRVVAVLASNAKVLSVLNIASRASRESGERLGRFEERRAWDPTQDPPPGSFKASHFLDPTQGARLDPSTRRR